MERDFLKKMVLPREVDELLQKAPTVQFAASLDDLDKASCGMEKEGNWKVSYTLPDGQEYHEADVLRVKNGVSVNYTEPYMRRRDPNCMYIADDKPTDKEKFDDHFSFPFADVRKESFQWLEEQDLALFAFEMGQPGIGGEALAICPANAAFFAFGLGLLQGLVNPLELKEDFEPSLIIYVVPPFRHTHFAGKQVVVHSRNDIHEIFSYNLYPGPSAKKGVYGALINKGVYEEWVTAHCSAVQVVTPYDNTVSFMHEGV